MTVCLFHYIFWMVKRESYIRNAKANRAGAGSRGYKKGERMAKGKYQEWLEPDGLLKLEGWARDGLTDEQIDLQQ